jgi:hypothetical protein
LEDLSLVICSQSPQIARTLGLAAVSSGVTNLVFLASGPSRETIETVAEDIMNHLGSGFRYIPVLSPACMNVHRLRNSGNRFWIVDAGDPAFDGLEPLHEKVYYFAENYRSADYQCYTIGRRRKFVSFTRRGGAASERAEASALCAQLLISVMAGAGVCAALEPPAYFCRISLTPLPASLAVRPSRTLYCGGGGAIAQQVMWAESLDPVLSKANRKGAITVVDPKRVHESCRSRQWAYPPETLHAPKAECTARWLQGLFPGVEVTALPEKLREAHFREARVHEVVSSVDNWSARKQIALWCRRRALPWYSTGSSFFGGFARRIDAQNPFCAGAEHGVERLDDREDDEAAASGNSCAAAHRPMASSVLSQMIIGSFVACQKRAELLGTGDALFQARGIEVHMTHGSEAPGFHGLRWGPGRKMNLIPGETEKRRSLRAHRTGAGF